MTETIPKALLEIEGQPFLWHQLQLLRRHGVRRVVLLVGYLGESIQQRIGDGADLGMSIQYSYDGPSLLGTAGAIHRALPLLNEPFFVLYGDSYLPCDYRSVEEAFRSSGRLGLMTVYRNDGRYDSSNVEYDGSRIVRYDKRDRAGTMQYIDYGLSVFHPDVFRQIPTPCDLEFIYKNLIRSEQLAAFEVHDRFYEIGSPDGFRDTADFIRRQ